MKKYTKVTSKSKLISLVPAERESDIPDAGTRVPADGIVMSDDIPRSWAVCGEDSLCVGCARVEVSKSDSREVTVEYTIYDGYEGRGYAADILSTLSGIIFSESGKYTIYSPVDAENEASIIAHESCGFYAAEGEEHDGVILYVRERPASAYTPTLMCLGIAVGMAAGLAVGHMSYGMCVGMILGAAGGVVLDGRERKRRKK